MRLLAEAFNSCCCPHNQLLCLRSSNHAMPAKPHLLCCSSSISPCSCRMTASLRPSAVALNSCCLPLSTHRLLCLRNSNHAMPTKPHLLRWSSSISPCSCRMTASLRLFSSSRLLALASAVLMRSLLSSFCCFPRSSCPSQHRLSAWRGSQLSQPRCAVRRGRCKHRLHESGDCTQLHARADVQRLQVTAATLQQPTSCCRKATCCCSCASSLAFSCSCHCSTWSGWACCCCCSCC